MAYFLKGYTMSSSVFDRYAQRFSELALSSHDEDISSELEEVMGKAGEELHSWIKKKKVSLNAVPNWLKAGPPNVLVTGFKGKELIESTIQPWDTYWWFAVLWLQALPESGIIISTRIPQMKINEMWEAFPRLLYSCLPAKYSDKWERQIWQGIIKASADACRFLASKQLSVEGHHLSSQKEQVSKEPSGLPPEGEWSCPMSLADMAVRLNNMTQYSFKKFAQGHGLRMAGSRQKWQIRLDRMDKATRQKLEAISKPPKPTTPTPSKS
jgi:hypothetical protein